MSKQKPKTGMARMMQLAMTKKPLVIASVVLSSLAAVASFIPYIAIYFIIRQILAVYPDLSALGQTSLFSYGWMALGGVAANIILYFVALMCSHLAAFGTLYELKVNFLSHLAKVPLGFHVMIGSGKLRKITDENIENVEKFIAHQLPDIVAAFVSPVVMAVILLSVDWRLGLVSIVGVVIAFIIQSIAYGREGAKKMMDQYQHSLENMNNAAVEYIRGISVVKAFKQTVYSFHRLHETIKEYTRKIAEEMHVQGLMNMQYAIENGKVYVLEANPRASRTVPLVSKVCDIRMVPLAIDVIMQDYTHNPSPVPSLSEKQIPYYGVKEAVFPFNMFPEVDPVLGPEMRSTGEVLGLASSFGEAFYKAQEATKSTLPLSGTVLISVSRKDKPEVKALAEAFHKAGFSIVATAGTAALIREAGIPVEQVKKLSEGRPNILDLITNGKIQLIVNTPVGKDSANDDSYLRKAAIKNKISYITTMAAGFATAEGILYVQKHGRGEVHSLQALHGMIQDKPEA